MSIRGLDHYNIAAPPELLERVCRFYCEVLGLRRGHRPAFNSNGYWLYAGDRALVHLKALPANAAGPSSTAQATGWFGHIAFDCSDPAEWRQRLDALGIQYEIDSVEESGQVQLFLTDPAGVEVELNFRNG